MTKVVDKNHMYFKNAFIKRFRSKKTILKYMSETPDQNWQLVDNSKLPPKAKKVFGNCFEENYKFYMNRLEQHIKIMDDADGYLFDISLNDYINKTNIGDSEYTPILIDFFKDYVENPEGIKQLFDSAYQALGFENLSKKDDIKKVNKWVVHQVETMMTPLYFHEKYYAYLIIIVGELLLRNKLKGWFWKVKHTKIDLINDDDDVEVKYIYSPYLCNEEGAKLDIHRACRDYLFYETGNVRNVFSYVYNNIEKYEVEEKHEQIGAIFYRILKD